MLNTIAKVRLTEEQKYKLRVMGASKQGGMSRVIRSLIDNVELSKTEQKKLSNVQVSQTTHVTQSPK